MQFTIDEFRAWKNKSVTLLGMSGVGKTHLSMLLRSHFWFHYSGDYRIGTRYLDEPIMDLIKEQAMQVPFLRDLLRNDWIQIRNNIKVHDLGPALLQLLDDLVHPLQLVLATHQDGAHTWKTSPFFGIFLVLDRYIGFSIILSIPFKQLTYQPISRTTNSYLSHRKSIQ